jgi:Flp pilus assembly protein TadD
MGKVLLARQNFSAAAVQFREVARLRPDDPEPKRYLQLLRQELREEAN